MARNVFEVSIFHLSPSTVEGLLFEDSFNMEFSETSYQEGILILIQSLYSDEFRNPWSEVESIFALAPEGTTHLYFHPTGVFLDLPLYDPRSVIDAYESPSYPNLWDDSGFAESGYEKLKEQAAYADGSASNFLAMIVDCEERLRRRVLTIPETFELREDVEFAYLLACGVEYSKLHSDQDWDKCNEALRHLGESVDSFIRTMDDMYCELLLWFENNLLATKARVVRALRVQTHSRLAPVG